MNKFYQNFNKSILLIFVGTLGIFSCRSNTIGSDRRSSDGFQLRSFQEETLANGLDILWIEDNSLPRISLQMMVKVGSRDELAEQSGLNAMVSSLLDQGSMRRSAPEIAADLAQIGAEFGDNPSFDQTFLAASGLSETEDQLLDIFSEIILQPTFTAAEVERKRSVILATLQKSKEQPSTVIDNKLIEQVFNSHPYSRVVLGDSKSIKKIKSMDLVTHYKKFYRPNNSTLAVAGKFDAAFKDKVRKAFAAWEKQALPQVQNPTAKLDNRSVVFVNRSGLQQTQIRWGEIGLARQENDFMAYRLANVILGGAFASRLNQKIRDDLGLTYSISSNSDARFEPGIITVSTFTRHDKAMETIFETEKLLKDFAVGNVSNDELSAAKALLIGQFPAAVETVDRLAMNLLLLRRQGIPDSYLQNFEKNVNGITTEQVSQAIKKHFDTNKLQLVIYSDEKKFTDENMAQLKQLGELKKIEN